MTLPITWRQCLPWLAVFVFLGTGLQVLNAARLSAPAQPATLNGQILDRARAARLVEIDSRFKQGVAMLRAGRYEYAAVAFHRVLELSPRLSDAHANLGFALLGMKRYQAAHDFFSSAVDLKPDQVNAYYGLALALVELGDLPGAIGAMRSYLHLVPANTPHARKAREAIWEWENARKGKPLG
jgi:tetratricopeptide (TPR) repeat protein